MIARLVLGWKRFWSPRDYVREAADCLVLIADAQRRHARTDYLWAAYRKVVHDQLQAGL